MQCDALQYALHAGCTRCPAQRRPVKQDSEFPVDCTGERRWFVLERPRRDTNGVSETETVVTVTSKLQVRSRQVPRVDVGDDDVYCYSCVGVYYDVHCER